MTVQPNITIEPPASGSVELMPRELWVLLWSQSQNALHVEQVDDMLHSNRQAYADNRRMDYVPLVFGSRAVIDDAARACRPTLVTRCEQRELAASH